MDVKTGASLLLTAALSLIFGAVAEASVQDALTTQQQLARGIFKELIEINTTDSSGNNTEAAEAMAARLLAAGFPEADLRVLGPHPRKGNLVARYRGSGVRPPLLLLAHLDVVEALPEDWSFDPFTLLEQEGYFYGRGTSDDKAMCAIWVANFIRMKQEGFVPDRDLILALTVDEEGGDHNGVTWLLENHRDLIDAEYSLNEGGTGVTSGGRRLFNAVQLSEKVYLSFGLEVTNAGGHSSVPVRDNAIYHLAQGLLQIADYQFPVMLDEITHTFFERMSNIETGQRAADMRAVTQSPPDPAAVERLSRVPTFNSILRTTCVATQLLGGHAENALPQRAHGTVNCRMFPGSSPEEVQQALRTVVANDQVKISPLRSPTPSPPSPLTAEVIGPIEKITEQMWPGVPVIPRMATGATDGLYLRNVGIPTYGVSGLFYELDSRRAHGQDERIGTQSFYEGLEFLYRLVRELSSV